MIKTIETKPNVRLARIEISDCPIAKGIISVDLHQQNSIQDQAMFECFGDLLLSGTKNLTREELLDKTNSLGSSIAVRVSDGVLTVEISGTKRNWNKTMSLVHDILTEPVFPTKELKRAVKLAFNNLHDEKEDSKAVAFNAFRNNFYKVPDRRACDQVETVQLKLSTLTNKDAKEMFGRMYAKSWTASITGDKAACLSFDKLVTRLAQKIVDKSDQETLTTSLIPKAEKLLLHDVPSRQNLDVQIGYPVALKPGDREFPALVFGVSVLAKWGGFAGRLMSIVREQEGLTYGIYGKLEGYNQTQTGYFRIETFFSPKQVSQGLQSTFREIKKMHAKGITEAEHSYFKTIMETQSIMKNDSPVSSIRVLHEFNKLGFSLDEMTSYESALQTVTRKEVNAAIVKYLDPKRMAISAAGPTKLVEKELVALSKKL